MKLTYDKGMLTFDCRELIESIPPESRIEFIDILSCDSQVIDFVMQQVLEGWTELGSHGPRGFVAYANPTTGIDKARRDIAKASSEIAKKEIEALEKALAESEKRYYDAMNERTRYNRTSY